MKFRVWLIFLFFFMGLPAANAVCVKVGLANLRTGPGSKYKISWAVGRYMPFKKIGKKGNWYKVSDLDGQTHWVFRTLVTNKLKCLAVRKNYARLKKGPSSSSRDAEFKFASKYSPFLYTEQKRGWYRVQDNFGNKGWLHSSKVWRPIRSITLSY